ncbi:DNA processing protein DprA [Halorhodospira abdelmalekii]|uniref:DNA-processing protein DprA n=1 Tax=Halorhodospira abdelmalekii TaxID=421629 RepID=UPI00190500EE|nr:DNA-processing protein DprA [Halorhodospira abdelmalekii]MBK1735575.1 DNA processing protein DprA [Halorhodospira abdelmalekii]
MALNISKQETRSAPISPLVELGAYEALCCSEKTTLKELAQISNHDPDARLSDFVNTEQAYAHAQQAIETIHASGVDDFDVLLHGSANYPLQLHDAEYPPPLLYYSGRRELLAVPSVAVIGTREPSEAGRKRARKVARFLAEHGYVVVSGLARGIDTEAHRAALEADGATIAVLGTPLHVCYPQQNSELQRRLMREQLVISQVPVLRHERQGIEQNRRFFPERNATMSVSSQATVIVEASERSGTLTQARAALAQGRTLFVLDSCFQDPQLSWPARLEAQGAIRLREPGQLLEHLE